MPSVLDPLWIPLPDGTRLAARAWLPDGEGPWPVVLEAVPYRRGDGTAAMDHPRYMAWAAAGLAGVRVDIRGSGDSDGVLADEYLLQEQDDDLVVLRWLAAQDWCTGRIGMIGYSWGGFSALQVAARRPPELGAIVTVNSTLRRYTDDCHYTGGVVNAQDLLGWATTMYAYGARPPDPEVVGERWLEMWKQRLGTTPMIEPWLTHQLEDDYWRHGSVAFEPGAITCPVLAVGGWADPYRNAVLDALTTLDAPTWGLIGPWAHGYPHDTEPGPGMAFLAECATFFGRHLRGDEGVALPRLRAYVQDYDPPAAHVASRSGRWLGVDAVGGGGREVAVGAGTVSAEAANGLAAGDWCPYGGPANPTDQRPDDAVSLTTDTEPLDAPYETLGFPVLRVRVAADRPRAVLVARLCDVAPDGTSLLVTRGVLDLTHREGHDRVVPVVEGETMDVELRLDATGHRFAAGHRIRVALSPGYWPWLWPSPEPVTLRVERGRLVLPAVDGAVAIDVGAPDAGEALEVVALDPPHPVRRIVRDAVAGTTEVQAGIDHGSATHRIVATGLETGASGENRYRITDDDPCSARVECDRSVTLRRGDWFVRIDAEAVMTCTADAFLVDTQLTARLGDEVVHTAERHTRRPRA